MSPAPRPDDSQRPAVWHLYVVRCRDGSLYAGVATDVARRFAEHVAGGARAARYTRGRGPLRLVARWRIGSQRGEALRAERRFKALGKSTKEALVAHPAVRLPARLR